MSRRAHRRRRAREASRTCLTASDEKRLDRCRRLPDDFPSIARVLKDRGERLSDKQLAALRSDVIKVEWQEAQPILSCLQRSRELRRWNQRLRSHPGPESVLPPEIVMLAAILATQKKGRVHQTVICQIINGMDTRIWHAAGMCDHRAREPISHDIVWQQLQRFQPETQIECVPQAPASEGDAS